MDSLWEWLVTIHIVLGALFVLVGSLGLLKLDNLMARLHAPSKATTLGVGGCLVASVIYFLRVVPEPAQLLAAQDLLVIGFLFLTAPVTAHFVAKAHLHRTPDEAQRLPSTGQSVGWATFDKWQPDGKRES